MYWACPRNTAGCAHTHPHTHKQKLISTGEIQWPAALLGALSSAHLASNRPMNLLTANISFTLGVKEWRKNKRFPTEHKSSSSCRSASQSKGHWNSECMRQLTQSTPNCIKIQVNERKGLKMSGKVLLDIGAVTWFRWCLKFRQDRKWRAVVDVTANHLLSEADNNKNSFSKWDYFTSCSSKSTAVVQKGSVFRSSFTWSLFECDISGFQGCSASIKHVAFSVLI